MYWIRTGQLSLSIVPQIAQPKQASFYNWGDRNKHYKMQFFYAEVSLQSCPNIFSLSNFQNAFALPPSSKLRIFLCVTHIFWEDAVGTMRAPSQPSRFELPPISQGGFLVPTLLKVPQILISCVPSSQLILTLSHISVTLELTRGPSKSQPIVIMLQ
jgi:hypothetical protein